MFNAETFLVYEADRHGSVRRYSNLLETVSCLKLISPVITE